MTILLEPPVGNIPGVGNCVGVGDDVVEVGVDGEDVNSGIEGEDVDLAGELLQELVIIAYPL